MNDIEIHVHLDKDRRYHKRRNEIRVVGGRAVFLSILFFCFSFPLMNVKEQLQQLRAAPTRWMAVPVPGGAQGRGAGPEPGVLDPALELQLEVPGTWRLTSWGCITWTSCHLLGHAGD